MTALRGIVMCGGQSTRMGTDKGLIAIQNSCWAAYMADKLQAVNVPVSISINPSQLTGYQVIFSPEHLITDSLNLPGPLNGLLSAHLKYPNDDLLLLACDMINMQTSTLIHLIDTYQDNPDYGFYVYQNNGYAEPFCGIYTSPGLAKLANQLDLLSHNSFGLQKVLNDGHTFRLQTTDRQSFNNYNVPHPPMP